MIFALVPVKDLSWAKERLSSVLSQEKRTLLAYAMLEDVLTALKGSKLLDRIVIVTMDEEAMSIASGLEIDVISETEQNGESASVDYGSSVCMDMGAQTVLVVPGDAPLITSEDIDTVLERVKEYPSVILVPATGEMGTNAIVRTPPNAIPSRFGEDSFRKHINEAAKRHIPYEKVVIPTIALDIDCPDDLRAFAAQPSNTLSYQVLSELTKKVAE